MISPLEHGASASGPIKVLVVDDTAFMVKAISDILSSDSAIEVVGTARNGLEGLQQVKALEPDVITLDIDMPIMDGLTAIRHIMIECMTPIVALSSLFKHGDITFEALRLGVVDFLPKPSGAISADIHQASRRLIERIKHASSIRLDNIRRVKLPDWDLRERLDERYGYRGLDNLVAIGTTLGGPNTVIRLLTELSPRIPAAVVVIQEISAKVLPEFAAAFDAHVPWKIVAAEPGQVLEQGCCYIGALEQPPTVGLNAAQEAILEFTQPTEGAALDALFGSAARVFDQHAVGVLLTGIGTDGAQGLQKIAAAGGRTLAQRSESCVYPNLTQHAIEQKSVEQVVDAEHLAPIIEEIVSQAAPA